MAQHDYNIANQSGAAFRADVNNALAAIVSQNSGPNEPSVTYAYQWWADTANGLLKIRNAANNGWVTVGTLADAGLGLLSRAGGTMTGALLADDNGAASAPAVAFDGDPDTGIYRKGANQFGIATGGAERVFVDSDGVTIPAQGDLRLSDSDSSNYVGFQAPATVGTNQVWTLPAADGSADQCLATNGAGVLSFAARSRFVAGTAVASTSGTAIDFTNIPSWAKRVTVIFDSVSTSGTAGIALQIGDSGGIETSGYAGSSAAAGSGNTTSAATATTGFAILSTVASNISYGVLTLNWLVGNTWSCVGIIGRSNDAIGVITGGGKSLSGTLDRVRITTFNGTDTFDGGTINVTWEG